MILQWGSTIKVSIEIPVATRHRRDMTEKLLKPTLNPNTHTHLFSCFSVLFSIVIISFGKQKASLYEPRRDKNQQSDCAPSEYSDQPVHPPSLIRVFAVRMKKAWVLSYPLSAQRRLWSDWADAVLLFCHLAAHMLLVHLFVYRACITFCSVSLPLVVGVSCGLLLCWLHIDYPAIVWQ